MPTPLAHGVAGYAAGRTFRPDWRSWRFMVLASIIASLPDLDFIPGILIGDAGAFHRRATHSFFAAFVFALPIALVLWKLGARLMAGRSDASTAGGSSPAPGFGAWYGFVVAVYASHLLLDLVSLDLVENSGLQLAWPFSRAYFSAPLPLPAALNTFFDLRFGPTGGAFFHTLFSLHAFGVYIVEALIFSPTLLIPVISSIVVRERSRGRGRRGILSRSR
jgi:membrane-bound metal-dependent hydrolase YbcI (DUF457 family)